MNAIDSLFTPLRIVSLLFILCTLTVAKAENDATGSERIIERILIQSSPEKIYPSGDSVIIPFIIKNLTSKDVTAVDSSGGFAYRIVVIDPDQKRVTPYPYYPINSGKFRVYTIASGQESFCKIDLSNFFPFAKSGDYQVEFTQRVYGEGDARDPHKSIIRGEPIDVAADSFRFRVESPSVTKLRDLIDPRTRIRPGDELDGINNLEWYNKRDATSNSRREQTIVIPDADSQEIAGQHGDHLRKINSEKDLSWIWLIGILACLLLVIITWRFARKRAA